jgi:hypothetical protein
MSLQMLKDNNQTNAVWVTIKPITTKISITDLLTGLFAREQAGEGDNNISYSCW